MADKKTTDLTPLPSALTTGDKLYVVRAGADYQADKTDLPFDASGAAAAVAIDLAAHEGDTTNPHSVTKTQVGLGNADDTSDANKPISSATQTALDTKTTPVAALTAAQGIKLDDFAAPDDNTDLNASTTKHGLSPKATAPAAGLLSVHAIGNGETGRTDQPIFDTTNPAALSTAAPGTALVAARRDHVHPRQTAITEAEQTLADNTTNNVSTTKHGYAPKAPNDATKFLDGTGAYSVPGGSGLGYCITGSATATAAPADATTYYFGPYMGALSVLTTNQWYVPKAGTLKVAQFFWDAQTAAGTAEDVSVYVRLNNTTDTLIATVGNTSAAKIFVNNALSIAVVAGDLVNIKMVCPTWATNPTGVRVGTLIYIE